MEIRKLGQKDYQNAASLMWEVFLEFEAPVYEKQGTNTFYEFIQDEDNLDSLDLYGAFEAVLIHWGRARQALPPTPFYLSWARGKKAKKRRWENSHLRFSFKGTLQFLHQKMTCQIHSRMLFSKRLARHKTLHGLD